MTLRFVSYSFKIPSRTVKVTDTAQELESWGPEPGTALGRNWALDYYIDKRGISYTAFRS